MPGIFQPIGSVKLTNVSVVRLKKGGKRYEVAAYKNKVGEFRKNLEKDLDNVVQARQIFSNVSRGEIASSGDLNKAFGMTDVEKIIVEILLKGELQQGKQERTKELESMFFEVATIISTKCINPGTGRPHPITIIMKAMRASHISIDITKSTKKQALEAIRRLKESNIIPIARAQMSVRMIADRKYVRDVKSRTAGLVEIREENVDEFGEWEAVGTVDPGMFKEAGAIVNDATKGTGSITITTITTVDAATGSPSDGASAFV